MSNHLRLYAIECTVTNQTQTLVQTEPTGAPRKKVYEPPRILSREALEAIASVCQGGGAKTNTGSCPRVVRSPLDTSMPRRLRQETCDAGDLP